MQIERSLLLELGFKNTYYVEGRASIADLFSQKERCGVYILHCGNDEYYVGQASDVARRFVQHRRNHTDIHELSFKHVRRTDLNTEEHTAIWSLQAHGFTLRNIVFNSIPPENTDFELIMAPARQEEWLANLTSIENDGERVVNPEMRRKYARRYAQYVNDPHSERTTSILREYVQMGIPSIKGGEMSFWCCSCLPAFHGSDVKIMSRINVNWQEVFTISVKDDILCSSFHLAISPLENSFDPSLNSLVEKYPGVGVFDHLYQPGGIDQIGLESVDDDLTMQLLHDPAILTAIRLFNLRLMNKGACNFSRYHCLGLADRLVE